MTSHHCSISPPPFATESFLVNYISEETVTLSYAEHRCMDITNDVMSVTFAITELLMRYFQDFLRHSVREATSE